MEITATVQRVAYPAPTTVSDGGEAWFILITDAGVCKGRMLWRPREMEQLVLEGEYSLYRGEKEFAFSSARLNIPSHPRDQLRYVVARTSGIGPTAEIQLWEHAGENWQNVPEGAIPRLRGRVYQDFKLQIEALLSKSEEARVVAALMGRGATQNMAQKAWATWEGQTLGVVNADCFRLAELEGYGFADVDRQIRREFGIGDSDPRRIRAAVIYALRKLTANGDTVVSWEDLYGHTCGMLCGFSDEVSEAAGELFREGAIKAFGEGGAGVALASDYQAESAIWEWVQSASESESSSVVESNEGKVAI